LNAQISISEKQNLCNKAYTICGEKVMLDRDLADLYLNRSPGIKASRQKKPKKISQ
jgi:hypothetical protein